MKRETIEATIIEIVRQQGHVLNNQDKLVIRTRVAACLSAKERYHQRMNTGTFVWKSSVPKR